MAVKRKGDTLYNVLDQYTGETITCNKVTDGSVSDSIVDNIIYFKYGSEFFKRNFTGDLNAKWFGVDASGINDSTSGFNAVSNIAKKLEKDVYVDKGVYKINGTVTFWSGLNASEGAEFILASTTGSLIWNPTIPFTNLNASTITGLVQGSLTTNLTNYKDYTILLRSSTETLIDRWDNGPITPYRKRQLLHVSDNNGTINPVIQQTYTDLTSNLTVRAYSPERTITINGLKIRMSSITTGQTPVVINRSNVVINDIWLSNDGNSSNASIGVAVNSGYNVEFNNPYISGFTDENNSSRLGYGIQLTECYDVRINSPHIINCKHTIMASFCTKVRIKGGTLVGVDNSGTGTANLQVLDTHWSVDFEVDGVSIYSKYGSVHGVCVAGKDVIIKNCKIYNCWSVCGMSATTPEIDGYWIAENNYIEFTSGASHMYVLGAFTSGADYSTTFTRMLLHPRLVRIANNRFINPNTTNFLLYRGITSIFLNGKRITERIEIDNNISMTGQQPWTLATSQLLQVREENKCTVGINPVINITSQPFEIRDYDVTTPAIRIYTRLKSSMTSPYTYELYVNGRGNTGYSFEVDVDALSKAQINNVDVLSLNGAQTLVGGEIKTPSYFWNINNCTFGANLPSGKNKVFINVGSARIILNNTYIISNLKLRSSVDGSKGPDQFTNFDDAIISAQGNTVKKDSQLDVDDVTVIIPPFKTDMWVNKIYFESTRDGLLYNYGATLPTTTDILTGKFQLVRHNDDSIGLYTNNNGVLVDVLSPKIGTSITTTSNITPKRVINSFSLSSATDITGTIQTSNYISAGSTIMQFRNVGVGNVTIAVAGGVTLTGAPFTLTTNDELVIISTGSNTYRVFQLDQKAVLTDINTGTENSKYITSKLLADFLTTYTPSYTPNFTARFVTNNNTSAPTKANLNTTYGTYRSGSIITYPLITGGGHQYRKLTDDASSDWVDNNWTTGISSLTS